MPEYVITLLGVHVVADDDEKAVHKAMLQLQMGIRSAVAGEHPVGLYMQRSGLRPRLKDWDNRYGLRDQVPP